ncbi:MAG: hypothetical protein GF383_15675 [Candidatus Lokiarchaeota archaeon]|nr:hypothetical protein [Candidatus Lokiarchaeota archaeon]
MLSNLDDIPEEYLKATKVVVEELMKNGEKPSEFQAQVLLEPDGKLIFHLWHQSAFKALEEAEKQGNSILGNPGGRCRDYTFDPDLNKVVNKWIWE